MDNGCVSIIIPVYNSNKYLGKCLASVLAQTYTKLQILLIDDGSKDESGKTCDEYAKKDQRIEVYHVKNLGVSCARNYGLGRVRGQYIQFVDSDDYLKKNAVETLVRTIEEHQVDMVVCNYIKVMKNISLKNQRLEKKGCYSNHAYLYNTLQDPGHHYYGVTWNKLYRTDIIVKHKLRFEEKINLGEDFVFNLAYWQNCKDVYVIYDALYYYNRINDVSLSSKKNPKIEDYKRELYNRKCIFQHYKKVFQNMGCLQQNYEEIYFYWIVFYIRTMKGSRLWQEKDRKEWNRLMAEDEYIQEALRVVSKDHQKSYQHFYNQDYQIKKAVKKLLRM